ncbi:MAG: STAS domain-containing protein [Rubrivivax sp.]|nr:STAS domain-containing protein [Rubrivivax sp.]
MPRELTLQQASAVHQQLQAALAGAPGPAFRLDAAALAEFDTSALAVLLEAHRGAQARGLAFTIEAAPPKLQQLASLYGVAGLLGLPSAPAGGAA